MGKAEKIKQNLSLQETFEKAQLGTYHHDGLVKIAVHNCEKSEGADEFSTELIRLLKYPMITYKPEPAVERVVKYISKLVSQLGLTTESANAMTVFNTTFDFLIKAHEANDKAVRYRSCQLISEIIIQMGNAEMEEDLCDRIFQAMLARLSDKVFSVRVVAVKALTRLQDPSDKKCPVIKAFRFLMSKDPNWMVRVECLRCIAPTRRTLLDIINKTRDINEVIRMTAFKVIAEKISVKALSIAQRLSLLETGLNDRSATVRKACSEKLLQSWLIHYQANILDLLNGLDITGSSEICEKSVHIILNNSQCSEVVEGFDLLNDLKLIIPERLSCESAFYYRLLIKHLSEHGGDESDFLEKVLPDAKYFIEYILSYCTGLDGIRTQTNENSDVDQYEKIETQEFILKQLLMIVPLLDVSDPVSRKSVLSLSSKLLQSSSLNESMIPQLMNCLEKVLPNTDERISQVSEIISEIMMPSYNEEIPINEEELRSLKLKLADVNMKLLELRELLDAEISSQNFTRAAELKTMIEDYEKQKSEINEKMKPQVKSVQSQPRSDDSTRLRCLSVLAALLQNPKMNHMSLTLRSYLDELVIPCIPEICLAVRNKSVQCLGLLSLCDVEVARKALPIFAQVALTDEESLRLSALEAIFDIILTFGLEFFLTPTALSGVNTGHSKTDLSSASKMDESDTLTEDKAESKTSDQSDELIEDKTDECNKEKSKEEVVSDSEQNSGEDASEPANSVANDLMHNLVSLLEDDSTNVRGLVAEGLSKLLLNGRVSSSKLLTRLFIAWYNPVTEDDVKLRHCLGIFFPLFAFSRASNQMLICESYLPTLRIIFSAPHTSPLSDIDEKNVSDLLIQLTNSKGLTKTEQSEDCLIAHDDLSIKICYELLSNSGYGTSVLCKALSMLDLSTDNKILVKDLLTLLEKIIPKIKERQSQRMLEKLQANLMQYRQADDSVAASVETAERTNTDDSVSEQEGDDDVIDSTVLDATTNKRKKSSSSSSTRRTNIRSSTDITQLTIQEEHNSNNDISSDDSTRNMRNTKKSKLNINDSN